MKTKYFELKAIENKSRLESAKELGYTHVMMWINSDKEYFYFLKGTDEEVDKMATEWFMEEKNEEDYNHANEFYYEYIDLYEIEEYSCL